MSAILPAALMVALCGVVAGGLAPWLLRRAPEPGADAVRLDGQDGHGRQRCGPKARADRDATRGQ